MTRKKTQAEQLCQLCETPARDSAYLCDDCSAAFYADLEAAEDLVAELEVSLSGQKAASYSPMPKTHGPPPEPNWAAGEALRALTRALRSWVHYCAAQKVRHSSPEPGMPANTPAARAEWLRWRVDGLALDPQGPAAADEIGEAVDKARKVIFAKPGERQYLGECPVCALMGPGGDLYAYLGAPTAVCKRCGAVLPAEGMRVQLLAGLDDRICTAAEIAKLTTYLGLRDDREKVRKRINTWHRRGIIAAQLGADGDDPGFRFGNVWRMLQGDEDRRAGAQV